MRYLPSFQLTEVAAVTARIKGYNATGELDIPGNNVFTLGTRVLLICDVKQLSEGSEVLSYRWYHNCTAHLTRCEIQDGDPYYRVVKDTLLVDVTSWNQGGRYYCNVHYLQGARPKIAVTPELSVAG